MSASEKDSDLMSKVEDPKRMILELPSASFTVSVLWITRNSGYLENRGYTAFHANTQRSF